MSAKGQIKLRFLTGEMPGDTLYCPTCNETKSVTAFKIEHRERNRELVEFRTKRCKECIRLKRGAIEKKPRRPTYPELEDGPESQLFNSVLTRRL